MIDWLLKLEPREAQLEALRRSYMGTATRDSVDGPTFERFIPGHPRVRPARGWGHLLEMRVGKTPTALNESALLRRDYDIRWTIVLAPNAFKDDWPLEAEKFGYPGDCIALTSTNRRQVQAFIDKHRLTGGLIVVNYEALQGDSLAILEQICGPNTAIYSDESIVMKNPGSGYAQAALTLAKTCAFRRILSGKPMTQGPHDLFMQFRFIGLLNGVEPVTFRNTYCKLGGFQGKQVLGVKNEAGLHDLFERNSFRGRKVDWLVGTSRPDYFERKINMLPEQAALYETMRKDFLVELADGTIVSADQVVGKLMKMQQIASGFIIDEEGKPRELMSSEKNPRIAAIRSLLADEITSKVVVVCHYQNTLDMVATALAAWQPAIIRGDIWHKRNDRSKLDEKSRFNNDSSCRVLVGQEQALRYGHTLMGNRADPCLTTVFYENNYSLNDRSQCEERNQGDGQLATVTIVDYIASPQDLAVIRALQRKEDIAATVLKYAREQGVLPRAEATD